MFKVGDIVVSKKKTGRQLQIREVKETTYILGIVKHDHSEKYPVGRELERPKEEVEKHARLYTKLDKAIS